MKQLYEVGETVILKNTGEDCIVLEVKFEKSVEITGREGLHSIFCYKIGVVGPNGNDKWTENALRKKHTPSEFSFNRLMDNLKLPQSA
jgi:hypothetical protein